MTPKQVGAGLLKVFLATVAAVALTTAIGMFIGIPQDVDRLEENIRSFELASSDVGPNNSIEPPNKTLNNEAHDSNPGSSTANPPLAFKHSFRSLLEGAVRWYPAIFCGALLGFLLLMRAGLLSAALLILGLAPLASLLDPGLALWIAVAGSIYFFFFFLLRKKLRFDG